MFGEDCVDHVRSVLTGCGSKYDSTFGCGRSIADDLSDLAIRADRVRMLSGGFVDVGLSPYVERMMELADLHCVAV